MDLIALWVSLALTLPTYGFAVGAMPPMPLMVALCATLAVATVFVTVISRTSARYGVGLVPLLRAAFGPVGALVPAVLRSAAGVSFSALWAWQLGRWIVALLVAATGWPLFALEVPGTSSSVLVWTLSILILFGAYMIATLGTKGAERVSGVIELGALALALGLVVFAGIASKGFGPWIHRIAPWQQSDLVNTGTLWLAVSMPVLLSAPEWARFAPQPYFSPRVRSAGKSGVGLTPWMIVPAGLALAFVGTLIAAASFVGRSRIDASVIPDSAGFGGLAAASVAALLAIGLFLVVAPMAGLYAPAVALSSLAPRALRFSRSLACVTGLAMLLGPVVIFCEDSVHLTTGLALALGPPVAVLLVDEVFVRRGRLLLEEVFLMQSQYSTVAGVTFSSLLAVLAGWSLHPLVFPWLALNVSSPLMDLVARLLHSDPNLLGWLFGVAVAAGIYLIAAPIERRLTAWARAKRRLAQWQGRREPKPAPTSERATVPAPSAASAPGANIMEQESSERDGRIGKGWD